MPDEPGSFSMPRHGNRVCRRSARAQVERKSLSCWNRCIPVVAIRFARGSNEAAAGISTVEIGRVGELHAGTHTHDSWLGKRQAMRLSHVQV
jgi:hypothetical protein